jgi:hypothetical protein
MSVQIRFVFRVKKSMGTFNDIEISGPFFNVNNTLNSVVKQISV